MSLHIHPHAAAGPRRHNAPGGRAEQARHLCTAGGDDNGCPYAPTNERSIDQAMAWHEGYRAALRWMMEGGR